MGTGLKIIQGDEFIVLKAKGQLRAVVERNFVGPHQCKEVCWARACGYCARRSEGGGEDSEWEREEFVWGKYVRTCMHERELFDQ
jgi:hypothetical protein